MQLRAEISELLEETFYVPSGQLNDATELSEFIRDSIDAVELIAVLSSEYAIQIEPTALNGVTTVGDVVRYVESSVQQPARVPLESF